jgi:type VI secretion system secreted protein VgrG
MGWTGNHNKRRTRLRQRPVLEFLDERCLLSTGPGFHGVAHPGAPALDRPHSLVRLAHEKAHPGEKSALALRRAAIAARGLERPAGALASGAATAYDPIIGAAATRSLYNADGTGMTVAVIDTGVDYNNPAFGGSFGPGSKVVAGFDFADDSANPLATSSQHGTAIAGLIGSEDPSDLGVAPGVKIIALRVTDGTNTASLNSVASALEWVIANHTKYNITAVNMSLSDGGNYAQNWFANDGGTGQQVTDLIGQLSAMNIPVIAATGNSFSGQQGEGFAAIIAGTISVTATDLSGNLLSDAQRLGPAVGGASATTIAAPGQGLTAPSGDSGTGTVAGTSFAAALVSGGVTLLQDIYQSRFGVLPSVEQIKSWLQAGSSPVSDPVTGITLGELNILKSASLIPAASRPQTPVPPVSVPVITPPPVGTSAPPPKVPITVKAPAAPVPVPSGPAPVQVSVKASSNVQVFVNGLQVDYGGSTVGGGALVISSFEQLLEAMSAQAANTASSSVTGATQVQIWRA